ncbi:MAG TPA: hypothetical protein VN176_14340 [Verrucomicrobiae bacterium]|nr:hypothetical protein [Verrucomicrobiae bacterium]
MTWHTNTFVRSWRLIFLMIGLLIAGTQVCSAISITSTSGTVINVDSAGNVNPNLLGNYVSYNITNDTGAPIADAWATIGNFAGGFLSLGINENGLYHIGPMAVGATRTVFFYLDVNCSSFQAGKCTIATAQTFVVSLYSGPPASNLLGSQAFSVTVLDTTAASANKVTSVVTTSNNPVLGAIVTVTTTGNTGTISSSNIFYYSPATYFDWPASSFRLYSTSISFASGGSAANQLLVPTSALPPSASDYTMVATYLVQGPTSTPTAVSPVAFIGSGTQVKHTDTSKFASSFPPIGATSNALTLSKLTSAAMLPGGGTTTYTLRATNTSSSSVSLDNFVDTLPTAPAAVTYVAGTSKFAGSSIPEPSISGGTLTWTGIFTVPANGTADLTFNATVPNTAGTYTNSAVGHIGSTQIDTTLVTTDNSPATVSLIVGTDISGKIYGDTNHNGSADSGEDWTGGVSVFLNLVQSGVVVQSITVPAGAGTFDFGGVSGGAYSIIVTNSATAVTAGAPAGYAFVSPTAGTLQVNVSNVAVANQNFGLFHGSLVSGKVFADTGASGGTANNGIMDSAEPGIGGVTVKATNGGATTYDIEQSASDGTYTLFIAPGATAVAIVETNPASYISTGASVGTTGGTYNRTTDTLSFTKAGEAIYTGVNFGDVPQNTFQSNGAQQGLPNSVLFYPHVLDPGTAGSITFSLTSATSPSNVGFTRILYQDTNCNGLLDSGEPVITGAVTTVAGTKLCIIMKVSIPNGAPFNATDATVISATFAYTNANPALSAAYTVTDSTTVGTGTNAGLRLEKVVDKASALPGANLTYTVTFINDSTSPLSNLKVNDDTPAYTTFVSAACGSPLPGNLTGCMIAAPSVGATGAIQWTFTGTLAPSQAGTVTFVVKIQ